ncbi:MAG: AbrB/MazE/SpoVT family DNA-binding domain-containing protein [Firmicutes bacterium]|nr:AbrB/MazE/SpoVT family DNA-binding domain-containing protein [Bacillota bacterium]
MAVVKLSSKRQITLPAQICRSLSLHKGDHLILEIKDGRIVLSAAPKDFTGYLKGIAKGVYGNSIKEVDAYVQKERETWR